VYYYRKDYNIADGHSVEVVVSNNTAARGTTVGPNTEVIEGVTKRVTIRVDKSFMKVVIIL
jgi:hypothetical protein